MWKGVLELGGIQAEGEFEIFDSGGGWEFLFGKPLLHRFKALHDFDMNTVTIRSEHGSVILHNSVEGNTPKTLTGIDLTCIVEQRSNLVGGSSGVNPPSRQVLSVDILDPLVQNDESQFILEGTDDILEWAGEDIMTKYDEDTQEKDGFEETGGDIGERDVLNKDHNKEQTTEPTTKPPQEEQGTNQGGGNTPPSREVLIQSYNAGEANKTDNLQTVVSARVTSAVEDPESNEDAHACQTEPPRVESEDHSGGNEQPPSRGVLTQHIDHHKPTPTDASCLVLPVVNAAEISSEDMIFTRHIDPFRPTRVAKILELVEIGEDIMVAQCEEVKQLIVEFADCFALSLSEVNLIPGAMHKLKVPEDATFHTKIPQCMFNPDQRAFMEAKVDEMLKGGIIWPMHPGEVKCVAPSVLAQKIHGNTGLSSDELKHKVNDECVKHGLPSAFDLPPRPPPAENTSTPISPKKWRLCQDFGEINKVTPIAPVPQGNIRAKQL